MSRLLSCKRTIFLNEKQKPLNGKVKLEQLREQGSEEQQQKTNKQTKAFTGMGRPVSSSN